MSNTAAATTQRRKRMFPAYTLAELKAMTERDPETAKKIEEEIKAREDGSSVHVPTPQVSWSDVKIPFI
jgi:hypothetical protein